MGHGKAQDNDQGICTTKEEMITSLRTRFADVEENYNS